MSPDQTPSTDESIAEVEAQLGVLFGRVRTLWKEGAHRVHPDLQPVGYKLLATLVRSGSCSAGALAELLATDKSVISRQVRLMEELGLVVSAPDPSDGRARILTATPEAVVKIDAIRDTNQAELRARLSDWSDDDLTRFATLLARLAQ
ncbi:MarR family transcriptional regulator [Leifsonia sp. Root4]|uniref:MarR family winged helix-turn-helix transcriptional regulator n=1 Tax=Leifsonia sp. Root4 TaxID=1736525 RepID=UPI00138F6D3E|nr:MarR family transcriptional regulator [Leifsonia sp. Root4]